MNGGTVGNRIELQNRIMFVLSALQDANEALDKCDRLVLEKGRERVDLSMIVQERAEERVVEEIRVEASEKEEMRAESGETEPKEKMQKGEEKEKGAEEMRRTKVPVVEMHGKASEGTGKGQRTSGPGNPSTELNRKREGRTPGKKRPIKVTKTKERRNDGGGGGGGEEDGRKSMEKFLKRVERRSEEQWENVTKFVRNILLTELEEEKCRCRSGEELNVRLAKQNQQLRWKLQEKRNERLALDHRMETIQRRLRRHRSAPRRMTREERGGDYGTQDARRHGDVVRKLTGLYEELERIDQGLNSVIQATDTPPMPPPPPPPQCVLKRSVEEETQVGPSLLAIQAAEHPPAPAETSTSKYVRSGPILILLSDIGKRINHLIQLNSEVKGRRDPEPPPPPTPPPSSRRLKESEYGILRGRRKTGQSGKPLERKDLVEMFADEFRLVQNEMMTEMSLEGGGDGGERGVEGDEEGGWSGWGGWREVRGRGNESQEHLFLVLNS